MVASGRARNVGKAAARARLLAVLAHPFAFLLRVFRGMARNRALLLSGALAYNALLTLIPFFTLLLLVLSSFMDEARLVEALIGAGGLDGWAILTGATSSPSVMWARTDS